MNKKAISSLISVVLLVGLSVTSIVLIATYSQDLFKSTKESSEKAIKQFSLERNVNLVLDSAVDTSQVSCSADLNNDKVVDTEDLAILLGAWGPNPGNPADITGNGIVNADDLALLLGNWGSCDAAAQTVSAFTPTNSIEFTVTNQADMTISSFLIKRYKKDGSKEVIQESLPANLGPYQQKKFSFNYQDDGQTDYFELSPIIDDIIPNYNIKFTPKKLSHSISSEDQLIIDEMIKEKLG